MRGLGSQCGSLQEKVAISIFGICCGIRLLILRNTFVKSKVAQRTCLVVEGGGRTRCRIFFTRFMGAHRFLESNLSNDVRC